MVLDGALDIAGVRVDAGQAALTARDGDTLSIAAPAGPARFTLFAGAPLKTQRVHGGPFVASSEAQLQRFAAKFRSGGFGALKPFATQPDWAPND